MFKGKLMVFSRVLAVCGLLLFLGGIGLGVYLIGGSFSAAFIFTSPAQTCSNCAVARGAYFLNLNVSDHTISESQTDALTAYFDYVPLDNDPQNIPITVTLLAPDFNFTPAIPQRTVSYSQGSGEVTLGWVLSPTRPGTFKVGVQVEMPLHSITEVQYVGITVTNVFGLNPWQIQVLSSLGTFLGPLLTAAWWYDRWQERKRKKSGKVSLASTTKSPKPHRRARQKQ
jgi:hypothetical protein